MKKLIVNQYLVMALRLLVGGLFLYACVDKIANPEEFALAIANYRFLPTVLVNLWAVVLPWVELAVGLFLVLGIFVEASSLLSTLMYLSFLIALTSALARGLDIDCGCFKQLSQSASRISRMYLARDFSLLAASLWIMFGYRGKLAIEALWIGKKPDDRNADT